MTAAACTVLVVVLAGCAAYAASVLGGRGIACLPRVIAFRAARTALRALIAARSAVIRARWAWACRKPPARTEGKNCLSEDESLAARIIELRWDRTAPEPERSS